MTNLNKKILFVFLMIILLIMGGWYILFAPQKNLAKKIFSKEIARYTFVAGDLQSKLAIIDIQGGPVTGFEENSLDYLVNDQVPQELSQAIKVNVHQMQTLSPELFSKKIISFEEAKKYAAESTRMVHEVILELKKLGKKVYVIGTSYGAFIAQDLLASYGNQADGYLIVVGRLDIQPEFWKGFSEGKTMIFKNGTDIEYDDFDAAGMGADNQIAQKNMPKLAAALGYKRYTQLLKEVDLSDVIFISSLYDEQVGRYTQAEVDFLKMKNAKLVTSELGHEETASKYIFESLLEITGMLEAFKKLNQIEGTRSSKKDH